MSDNGAFSGAMMLSQQLRMYRWMDTLERAQDNNGLATDNALLRRDAEQVVASYNQLVAEFNELLLRATQVAQDSDRKDSVIAELQQEAEQLRNGKAALEAECERLRRENTGQAIRIQWLSDTVREDRPGYLPDC
jgi:hypothetical protein